MFLLRFAAYSAIALGVAEAASAAPLRPSMVSTGAISAGRLIPLRGGSSMKRALSHENLGAEVQGHDDTLEQRIYAKDDTDEHRSLWHDLPLFEVDIGSGKPTGFVNFVCEIPKYTRKKFEIATKEPMNPIKQDEKKGQLRSFKKGDIYFNYGCFPRTWEDPDFVHPDVGVGGDNDPLDVCEIGLRQIKTCQVRPVKVLGVLCMIDEGEADWKVIAIDKEDPWADKLNDISDVEKLLPGTLDVVREWFRTYKVPDGKPENKFAFDEKFMDRAFCLTVMHETHRAWARLVKGNVEEEEAAKKEDKPAARKFTMKRNLSVPALDAMKQVEGSLLEDETRLTEAMNKAAIG